MLDPVAQPRSVILIGELLEKSLMDWRDEIRIGLLKVIAKAWLSELLT